MLHDACGKSGHPVGEPLGRGAALRLADAQPARRARALRAARRRCSASRSTPTSSRRRRGTTRSRSARPSPPTRRRPPTSTSSSGARTSSTTRPSCPSGDALAAELTRFLRERDEEDGEDPAAREQRRVDPVTWSSTVRGAVAERERVGRDPGREAQLERALRQAPVVQQRVEPAEPVHADRLHRLAVRRAPARGRGRRARGRRSARGSAAAAARPGRRRSAARSTARRPT